MKIKRLRKIKLLKTRARKLPRHMSDILAAKGSGRTGKHSWRDNIASSGAASPVRVLMKDGRPVDA